ncbi:MAG: hypothetical protein ACK5YN_01590, partial [Gemmatimonas sp.]
MRLLHRSRHIVVTLLVSAGALAPAPLASQAAAARPAQAPPAGSAAEAWWRHVQVLAHDSLKGRDTGSPGHESAVRYIARQFEAAGLKPGGTDGW